MPKVRKRPVRAPPKMQFPENDRLLIVLDLIVEYGKFYREWKKQNPDKIAVRLSGK